LSDPGKQLIKFCWEKGINFEVLPGPNALIPAVVASCFPTDKFCFYGFLPQKKGREKILKQIINSDKPIFFYESVHRIEKLFKQLKELGFNGKIFI
jgi:16S rRNA (cytidine1402-2'-O)-methyltransferase